MRVKLIIGIISIILIVFIVFLIFFSRTTSYKEKFPSTDKIQTDFEGALQDCENIEDTSLKNSCYMLLVLQGTSINKSVSVCKKIIGSDEKQGCYKEIYNRILISNKNISTDLRTDICNEIGDEKNNCFIKLVESIASKDINKAIEICDLIDQEAETDKQRCYDSIMFDISENIHKYPNEAILICGKLPNDIDGCYRHVALKLRDQIPKKAVESCELIKDLFIEGKCYEDVWIKVPSSVQSDPDLSIELCGRLKTNIEWCYQEIAKSLSQTSITDAIKSCNKIADDLNKEFCFQYIY